MPRSRPTLTVVLGLATSLLVAPSASAQSDTAVERGAVPTDPTFLLGTWHVTETIFPGTEREYVERTVRVCSSALQGTYVHCRAMGAARGRQRESWFLVNQPGGPGTIEFVGVLTNIPQKTLYRGRFLEDGSGIDLQNFELGDADLVPGRHQRLRFVSPDEFVWEIGISNLGTPEETVIGIERAVRVSRATTIG